MSIISENFKTIVAGVVGAWFAARQGWVSLPDVAVGESSELFIGAGLFALILGYLAAGRIESLLPDPPVVHLIVIDAADTERIESWELSPDQFGEMDVVAGTLNELTEAKERAYECYHYDPEENVAVGTWRQSKPASEIVGHHEVGQALDEIGELRSHLEPMARRGRHIRRHLPSIVRELDLDRMDAQNAALEGHVAPSFGGRQIEEVLAEQLPDDLQPDRVKRDGDEPETGEGDVVTFDVLEGDEALEPIENGDHVE